MADTSSLRSYINANMTSYGTQGITGPELVTCLLSLCDLLDAYGTTFNKVGTTSAGANAEDVYHTGKVGIGNTSPSEQLHITGNSLIDGILKFPNTVANKRIALYDATGNTEQFFGMGYNANVLRFQIASSSDNHIFYAGASPTTSTELMRIMGNGRVGIGTGAPDALLDLGGATGIKQLIYGAGGSTAYKQGFGTGLGTAPNTLAAFIGPPGGDGINGDGSFSVASATTFWPFTAYTTRFTVLSSGNAGIGTVTPTSTLHVKGATGHQQLRLETSYTPTSSSDTNGQTGQIAWDASYLYVKTGSGWKRSALSTF